MNKLRNWAVGVGLLLAIAGSTMGAPSAAMWAWPDIDTDLLVAGNLFFGMILGSAGILGFVAWLWREDRR